MAGYGKFQTSRNKNDRNVGLSTIGATYNKSSDNLTKSERLMNGIADWASFYRANPHIFVEEYLGIKLRSFQKVILYTMMHYNYTMFLASRGLSKTFTTAIYCVTRCILYPGTKIVIASGVLSQGMKVVSEKIPEMINISRTGTIPREIKGSIRTNMNGDDANVLFHNGSWIKVVPSTQNARSSRANVLLLDEYRMIKPEIYASVLRRFLSTSRQPGYLQKPEYNKPEFQERNQEIFLSSCYYKYNWAYARYKVFLSAMVNNRGYFVCGLPYQIGIKENLSSKEQLLDEINEDDFDSVLWEMEMKCLFYGESAKAYFRFDEITKCRNLNKPSIPFTDEQYVLLKGDRKKLQFYRQKVQGEYRILAVDLALIGGKKNDATQYMVISMIPQGSSGYIKSIEYAESADGGNTEKQAFRTKQLFYDMDCDYCVLDTMGNGIGVYDSLTKITIDENRDIVYPAWVSMNEETKAIRSIEKEAIPVVYSVTTSGQNSGAILHEMYTYAKTQIEKKKVKLLINELEAKEYLIEKHDYLKKDAYDQAIMMLPYLQTSRMITELTQLESETRGGFIKLMEPSGKRKDRAMCFFYGMFYIKILESEIKKKSEKIDYSKMFNSDGSVNNKKAVPFNNRGNPFSNKGNPFTRR